MPRDRQAFLKLYSRKTFGDYKVFLVNIILETFSGHQMHRGN